MFCTYLLFYCNISAQAFDLKALEKSAAQNKNLREKYLAKSELAKYYIENDDLKSAEKCVKDCADFDYLKSAKESNCGTAYLRCFLEAAKLEALQNNPREALRLLSIAESNTEGFDNVIVCMKYGEILTLLDDSARAKEYLDKAENVCKKYIDDSSKLVAGQAKAKASDLNEWLMTYSEISEARQELRLANIAKEFGKEYGRYVKMRSLYFRKKFAKSEKVCDEIIKLEPSSIYGQAAAYFKALCVLNNPVEKKEKRVNNALKMLGDFAGKNPSGLYAGEALMELGKIELEENWDAKKSAEYYRKALDFFRNMREKEDAKELYAVLPEKVKDAATPKTKPVSYDKWYRMKYNSPSDMAIENQFTAPWFVSEKEKECLFMTGFFLFMDNKFDEAKKCWSSVGDLDADLAILGAKNIPNVLWRLEAACNIGYVVFSPDEKKYLKDKKNKIQSAYAELNYMLERFDTAQKYYNEIIKNQQSTDIEKGIAYVGIGNCYEQQIKKKEAEECFTEALSLVGKTPIYGSCIFRLGRSWNGRSDNGFENANKYYEEYLKKNPDGRFAEQAEYYRIMNYFYGGKEAKARMLFNKSKILKTDSSYRKEIVKEFQKEKKEVNKK